MDRSLNADDFRLLESVASRAAEGPPVSPAPTLADLPAWFAQVVREQAAWLGIEVPAAAAGNQVAERQAA